MSKNITKVRLLISSPGDVQVEREKLREVVAELNHVLGKQLNFVIEPVGWETHCHPALGRPQAVINEQIGSYDIFVGIMWKRFGTPTGVAESGTEEEFRIAYSEWEKKRKLIMLFYFSQAPYTPQSAIELSQHLKVLNFKEELRAKGLVWDYQGTNEFPELIRRHLSDELWGIFKPTNLSIPERLHQIQEELDINQHYRIVANTTGTYSIIPKHSTADRESPIVISSLFEFPDTEEGRQLHEQFKRSLETGEPVTIPADYVKGVELSDLISSIIDPSSLRIESVTIGVSALLQPLTVRASFEDPNGKVFTLDYIQFDRAFKFSSGILEEVIFSNKKQPVPWKLNLTFSLEKKSLLFNDQAIHSGLNVKQELDALRLQQAIAQGGILRMEDIVTGFEFSAIAFPAGSISPPQLEYVRILERLVFIQRRVKVLLAVPDSADGKSRGITADEAKSISETAQILESGRASLNVKSWTTSVDKELARRFIELFEDGQPKSLSFNFQEERVEIFGTSITLGPVIFVCEKSHITDSDLNTIKQAINCSSADDTIEIKLTPIESCPMLAFYPNWMPEQEREEFSAQFRRQEKE